MAAAFGVDVRSFRERYTKLSELDTPSRGNLMVLSLPAVEVFHSDEFSALDQWVRRGNTLLINAALLDQPGWAARRASGAVVEIESLTAIEFETRKAREARLDNTPLSKRVREADARDAQDKEDEDETRGRGGRRRFIRSFEVPEKILYGDGAACVAAGREDARARDRLRGRGMVAAHAL